MYIALIILSCIVLGYLFGSIPTSVIIGKVFFHKDVRDYGSKNMGGTNAGRVFGKKVGVLVIVLDCLKTIIPIYIAYYVLLLTPLKEFNMASWGYATTALSCLIGHCFPIFAGFRGGKAVSCFGGICLATSWLVSLVGFSLFLLILKWKKMVSFSSILSSVLIVLFTVAMVFIPNSFGMNNMPNDWIYVGLMAICSVVLIIRHRENIKRIINHEERKISWMK